MAKVDLNKESYNKNQYQKVIDTSFTQLIQPPSPTPIITPTISIAEFFSSYQQLFFQIPKFGEVNSHEYIVKTSQEYIGSNNIQDNTIQALIDEINQLRQENFELQNQIISGSI
jgi:hypothetical protein